MVSCAYCGHDYPASWNQKQGGCPNKPHKICAMCSQYNGKSASRCRICGHNEFFKMGTVEAKSINLEIRSAWSN